MTGVQTCALPICFPVTILVVAKGSTQVISSSLSLQEASFSSIVLGKKEATEHLLQVRAAFVARVDNLPDQQVERIESDLMTAEQTLLTVQENQSMEALSRLKTTEQYIYHASFLLNTNT